MNWNYQRRVSLTAIIMVVGLALIAAALWMPEIPRKVNIVDSIFVLDITDSMNVVDATLDGKTVSRMAWAKEFTRRTIREMPCGSKTGLAVFSEARSLILMNPVEVCSSYHDLLQMLDQLEPYMAWVRSSEVSKAVHTAIQQAREIKPEPTIVMITDGHESPPISDTLFPRFSGKPGEIPGVLVGVGGQDLLPIPKTNEHGVIDGVWAVNEVMHQDVYAAFSTENTPRPRTEHLSSQKKSHLETLANRVGFDFISSPDKPSRLIDKLLQVSEARQAVIDYDPYPWLSAGALLLLILVFFPYSLLRHKRKKTKIA